MRELGRGVTTDTVIVEMTGQEYAAYKRGKDSGRLSNFHSSRNLVVTAFGKENQLFTTTCEIHPHFVMSYAFPCPECGAIERAK